MTENSKIGVHREINSSVIRFEQELLMNIFYGLVKLFNNEIEKDIIEVSKSKLWELMGFKDSNYNSEHIRHIIKELTKSNTYEISKNEKVSGSVFVTRELENSVQIEIPQTFRQYIFNKTDVGILAKVKQNQKLDIKELDYWDNTLKTKKKSLVLLKEADFFNISGKYAKRLYTLLAQWRKTCKLIIKMDKFKQIMEIPESYRMSSIDIRVFKPAINEISTKTDIKNIKVNKIKVGRKVEKIEITFSIKENKYNKIKEAEIVKESKEIEILQEFFEKKTSLRKQIEKSGAEDKYLLIGKLMGISTDELLEDFIKEHNLKLN